MAKRDYPKGDVPFEFYTAAQLINYIQTAGKRAQSRIVSLEKAYAPGGSLAGRQSYVLDRFGGLNTKTKGLSENALRLKAEQVRSVLEAKSSTVKGVKEIDRKRMETFKEQHPGAKVTYQDKRGRTRSREPNKREWERAMQIMGKLQRAEKDAKYDSNEQLFMAFKLATTADAGVMPRGQEEQPIDDLLFNESGDLLIHSDDFVAQSPLDEVLDFMEVNADEWESVW